MDERGIIYKATNTRLSENNIYIGKTWRGLENRILQHVTKAKSGSQFMFHKALIDNDFQNFSWEIIDTFLTEQEGKEKEDIYIKKFNAKSSGYNTGPSAAGRPKKYTTLEQLAQSKRDKAKRWYYKSKKKPIEKVVSIIPKQTDYDEIVAVPMDDDDDSPKAIASKVLSSNATLRLKQRLLGTG